MEQHVAKIADFCISKVIDTKLRKVIGTEEYMAPELFIDNPDNTS